MAEKVIWEACRDGKLDVVKSLAVKIPDLSKVAFEDPSRSWIGQRITLIMLAATSPYPDILWFFLCQWSIDPNQGPIPPVWAAIFTRNFECAEILVCDRRVNLAIPPQVRRSGLLEVALLDQTGWILNLILASGRPLDKVDIAHATRSAEARNLQDRFKTLVDLQLDERVTRKRCYFNESYQSWNRFESYIWNNDMKGMEALAPRVFLYGNNAGFDGYDRNPTSFAIESWKIDALHYLLRLPQADIFSISMGLPPLFALISSAFFDPKMLQCLGQFLSRPDADPNQKFKGKTCLQYFVEQLKRPAFYLDMYMDQKAEKVVRAVLAHSRKRVETEGDWKNQLILGHGLFPDYEKDWETTRYKLLQAYSSNPAAHMLAQGIFLSDGLLRIEELESKQVTKADAEAEVRLDTKMEQLSIKRTAREAGITEAPQRLFFGYPVVAEDELTIVYQLPDGSQEFYIK